jgi:hypothetical protein
MDPWLKEFANEPNKRTEILDKYLGQCQAYKSLTQIIGSKLRELPLSKLDELTTSFIRGHEAPHNWGVRLLKEGSPKINSDEDLEYSYLQKPQEYIKLMTGALLAQIKKLEKEMPEAQI